MSYRHQFSLKGLMIAIGLLALALSGRVGEVRFPRLGAPRFSHGLHRA